MTNKLIGMRKRLTKYGDQAFSQYLRDVFLRGMGYTQKATVKPVIGITNTFSSYNACHRTVPDLINAMKRGVMLAGGLPMEFPIISLHESFSYPTSMLLRNQMAMDVEEMIKAQPMDAVILIGGCDKTVPALVMGAISANIPSILIVVGPALTGSYQGERVGACTDCRRFWFEYRGGRMEKAELQEVNAQLASTAGTCSVMGTASTMACITEAMGLMLPGSSSAPAVSSERLRIAEETGKRAMELVEENFRPTDFLTKESFRNALRMLQAVGGSTNGVVHIAAMAGRLGLKIDLDELNEAGDEIPMIVDLKPSGQHYMEDLHESGGVPGIMKKLSDRFDLDCKTVTGKSIHENISGLKLDFPQQIICNPEKPIYPKNALVALKGNLAPHGAVIKISSATKDLLIHTGKAVVFDSLDDLAERIDDPDLGIEANDILVLRGVGPVGAPGMPEAGFVPIPKYLLEQGVKDMVRISDARMSGTAFGTTVLHVSPESAVGGPLALVVTGDQIELNVWKRRIQLLVDGNILMERSKNLKITAPVAERGYVKMYIENVTQAHEGCDFRFLTPSKE